MKTNVIIITRTDAYLTPDGYIKAERKLFGEELNKKSNISPNNINAFLWAIDTYLSYEKEYLENPEHKINYSAFETFLNDVKNIRTPLRNLSDHEKLINVLKQIMRRYPATADNNNPCYVHFEKEDYNIFLLLWDRLWKDTDFKSYGRNSSEKIVPFDLFIEQVCLDCKITDAKDANGNTNNQLYVHDRQLIEVMQDTTVYDRSNSKFTNPFEKEDYYKTLTDYFDYVATFGHLAYNGTFQNNILKLKFGPTDDDKIAQKEVIAKNFRSLRDEAVEIIK